MPLTLITLLLSSCDTRPSTTASLIATDGLEFVLTTLDGKLVYKVTNYVGTEAHVVIPEKIGEFEVISIGLEVFNPYPWYKNNNSEIGN